MKKVLLGLTVFLTLTVAHGQWTQLNSGTTNSLTSLFFLNNDTGFVVGFSGTILKTIDGGLTWLPQNSGTNAYLAQVVFIDNNNGIIVGDSGIVLKTINAGQTWIKQNSGTAVTLYSVWFTSLNNGIAVGDKATMLKTNDGGITWFKLPPVPTSSGDTVLYELNSVRFASPNIGYSGGGRAFGAFQTIYLKTTDGGNSWTKFFENNNVDPHDIYSLFPIDDNRVWSVGFGGPNSNIYPKLIYTNDGGNTITIIPCPNFCYTLDALADGIFFTNISTGYIVSRGKIIYTTDGGISWLQQYIGTNTQYDGIYFVNDTVGYIVGENGQIYKTSNGGGIIGINESSHKYGIKISPNPLSTQTVLQTDNLLHNATLTVDNCFGQTVAQIKNLRGQTIVFNRDNLASGLYFVRLTEENKTIAVDKLVIADK